MRHLALDHSHARSDKHKHNFPTLCLDEFSLERKLLLATNKID